MTLDLSQTENQYGVLSFDIDGDIAHRYPNASKILYDDIDINKAYRTGVSLGECDAIQLLQ